MTYRCTCWHLAEWKPVEGSQISECVTPMARLARLFGFLFTQPAISKGSSTPKTSRTNIPGAGASIPVEILLQIAWDLPHCVPCDGRTPSPTRPHPRHLYALATTCKGFWHCLRPLLFEADVVLETMCVDLDHNEKWMRWDRWSRNDNMSALSWSLAKGHTSTAELAIVAARSMGLLDKYTSTTTQQNRGVLPNLPSFKWNKPRLEMDPLFIAIVLNNYKIVELLTAGMPSWKLSRDWYWPHLIHDSRLTIAATPLNLAIWMGHRQIVALLLHRFSEVDQTTLKWDEPGGLGLACFLGDVQMARLVLDGEAGADTSPWVPRMRSQLSDPRRYDMEAPRSSWCSSQPFCSYDLNVVSPWNLVSMGMEYDSWRGGSTKFQIMELLAERAPHDLPARP